VQAVGRAVEIVATIAIVLAVGFWGRLILAGLERNRAAAAAVLALAIVATIVVLRRDYRGPREGVRLAVTRDVAYLTALVLVLWAVVAPARWVSGSALAMTEVAVVFDAFTRLVPRT
jgi:hypothetical protein